MTPVNYVLISAHPVHIRGAHASRRVKRIEPASLPYVRRWRRSDLVAVDVERDGDGDDCGWEFDGVAEGYRAAGGVESELGAALLE